jgi:hypothetical protein
MNSKNLLVSGAGVALSLGLMAAPAQAIMQDGLVNVAADDVNVQVPISVAATLCGVGVNVLATATNTGDIDCTTEGVAIAERGSSDGSGGPVRQRGLVNVALTDVNIQVPVVVAASVCGVAVGVLADATNVGDVVCETEGVALAEG